MCVVTCRWYLCTNVASLLLTVFGPVVVGMCSSMDFLWLIIRLSIGWLPMMLTVVVHVTHLNLRILSARLVYYLSLTACWRLSSTSLVCFVWYNIIYISCEDSKHILYYLTHTRMNHLKTVTVYCGLWSLLWSPYFDSGASSSLSCYVHSILTICVKLKTQNLTWPLNDVTHQI